MGLHGYERREGSGEREGGRGVDEMVKESVGVRGDANWQVGLAYHTLAMEAAAKRAACKLSACKLFNTVLSEFWHS